MKLKLVLLCVVLAICAWAMHDLTTPGLYTSHDGSTHVQRIVEFHRALNDGQFPPRWGGQFFDGLGSPVMILNYQLPYFVADANVRLGMSYVDSFKATMIFAYVASAIVAFFVFTDLFGLLPGFVATVLWITAPYRFVDIYVRAAFGEAFSFIFPPLVLWAIIRKKLNVGVLAFAALFLSHPVASALYSVFFLGYSIAVAIRERSWSNIKLFFIMFLLGFSIAAYNLIPSLLDTKYTQYTPLDSAPLQHFPTFHQLVYSQWGYGFSTPDDHDHLSYQAGITHWITLVLTSLSLVFFLITRKRKFFQESWTLLAIFAFFSFWISIFFMLQISTPIWTAIHLVNYIDFPWRILLFTVFCSSVLSGWLVSRFGLWIQRVLAVFLVVLAVFVNRNHIHINAVSPLNNEYLSTHAGTGDSNGEYASMFRVNRRFSVFPDRLMVESGIAQIHIDDNRSQRILATISATDSAAVRLNVQYYPGWIVRYDGIDVTTTACGLLTKPLRPSQQGLLDCHLPIGTTTFLAEYERTPAQQAGIVLSLVGVILYLWLIFPSFFQHSMKKQTSYPLSKKLRASLRKSPKTRK